MCARTDQRACRSARPLATTSSTSWPARSATSSSHAVAENSGHLGSNLGAVELTLALHRVFDSPTDAILWDTGHQAYVHKIVTGRRDRFDAAAPGRRPVGLPEPRGEPARLRREQPRLDGPVATPTGWPSPATPAPTTHRHIVAVIGDGSMTGGMAYEALNNLGHSQPPGDHRAQRQRPQLRPDGVEPLRQLARPATTARADHPSLPDRIAERLSHALTNIRLNPVYVRRQRRLEEFLRDLPVVGTPAETGGRGVQGRRARVPPAAVVLRGARRALRRARSTATTSPSSSTRLRNADRAVGRGADRRPRAHPEGPRLPAGRGRRREAPPRRARVRPRHRARRRRCRPGTRRRSPRRSSRRPSPTRGSSRSPRRCRARPACSRSRTASPTASSTSASPSSTPSPAPPAWRWAGCGRSSRIYSTFLNRAWDQVVYDVALHRLPVVFCLDRAGITGPDGAEPPRRVRHGAALARCRACGCSRRRAPQELQPDAARRDRRSPTTARSRSATRRARRARSASTRSASGSRPRRRAASGDGDACASWPSASCVDAAEQGRRRARRRRASTSRCGTCAAARRSTPR